MGKQFSDVNCRYGAPMGRRGSPPDGEVTGKVRLYQVNIDSGGYDDGGAYWGLGPPTLYCAEQEHSRLLSFFRARSRNDAKLKVLAEYPDATFYN